MKNQSSSSPNSNNTNTILFQIFGEELNNSAQSSSSKRKKSSTEPKSLLQQVAKNSGGKKSAEKESPQQKKKSKSPKAKAGQQQQQRSGGRTNSSERDDSSISSNNIILENLSSKLSEYLSNLCESKRKYYPNPEKMGRLGPEIVKFDIPTHVGSFIASSDKISLVSQSSFASIKANTCVFKGKWQYEIQLRSKGIMQIGWATLSTRFTQEKGVGDTPDSYSFDGNRLKKWNKTSGSYGGENWEPGDIIGSCIDLDVGTIEFFRNGVSLGVAFKNVLRGSGIAYFPAVSLSYHEQILANFGEAPMHSLKADYNPIQLQQGLDMLRAEALFKWLDRFMKECKNYKLTPPSGNSAKEEWKKMLNIANAIFEQLGPNLHSIYVVEKYLLPFFAKILGLPEEVDGKDETIAALQPILGNFEKFHFVLDLLWSFLEEHEIEDCLERVTAVLLTYNRKSTISITYALQHYALRILIALSKHRKTRRHLIRHLFFDKTTRIINFIHVRHIEDSTLKELIPNPWWPGKTSDDDSISNAFELSCNIIQQASISLEVVQFELLKILMDNTDGTENRPSSRALFLKQVRLYLKDCMRSESVYQQPMNKSTCVFYRLLRLNNILTGLEITTNVPFYSPIPSEIFYDTSMNYFDIERVGGTANTLYKAHHKLIATTLNIPDYISTESARNDSSEDLISLPRLLGLDNLVPNSAATQSQSTPTLASVTTQGSSRSGHPNNVTTNVAPTSQVRSSESSANNIASTQTIIRHQHLHTSTPTSVQITEEEDENYQASTTSSGEDLASTERNVNPQHGGAILINGTNSGPNLIMPMLSSLRNYLISGGLSSFGRGVTVFTSGFFNSMTSPYEHTRTSNYPKNPAVELIGRNKGSMDINASLRELLDDAIVLFSTGIIRHIEKVAAICTTMNEYGKTLEKLQTKVNAGDLKELEKTELQKSIQIFTAKMDDQSRHVAWVKGSIFTVDRHKLTFELLRTILATLRGASQKGNLFKFVPEIYIATMSQLAQCFLTNFPPTLVIENLEGWEEVLKELADFVANHIADTRIMLAETKDVLTQTLSSFISDRKMLTALETISSDSQQNMMKSILRPFENRAWAQSNWMLLRIWQGNGFAFRYLNTVDKRKTFRSKTVQEEYGISTNLPPTPSPILQSHIAAVLSNQKAASKFIHSLLNQLNWSFSEFIGLFQEIQNASDRPERVFIEARQLKIACTCYELAQALLRVLEMIINISGPVLTDFSKESAETLLIRLIMLLSQILNRIGSSTGTFSQVLDLEIYGLESIGHFPLLSSAAGILIALLREELDKEDEAELPITKSLISEPSFQVGALNFLLGREQPDPPEGKRVFSLRNYVPEDVTEEEIEILEKTVDHMIKWTRVLSPENRSLNEDEVCTICYANTKSVTFKPCNHRSCRPCVLHHLMSKTECFFCKAVIEQVFDDDGSKIHDVDSPLREPSTSTNDSDSILISTIPSDDSTINI